MRDRYDRYTLGLCGLVMVLLILDSGCAARSAAASIELCLRTVIPGLFPMLVLSAWMVPRLGMLHAPWLAKALKIPAGSEGLFLLGLVGGFPTGGAVIAQAVSDRSLDRTDAARMLGFCNNCAPAFVFGVAGAVLGELRLAAALAGIQVVSALLIGMFWPGRPKGHYRAAASTVTLPQAVRRAASGLVNVCAWVVLASVMLGFWERWVFPMLSVPVGVFLTGALELTSGCLSLAEVGSPALRFALCCFFVCFGGISVLAQIHAFAAPARIDTRVCVIQKLCQGLLAGLLGTIWFRFGLAAVCVPVIFLTAKKAVEILRPVVYNTPSKGGI